MIDAATFLREAHVLYGRGDLNGAAAVCGDGLRDAPDEPDLIHMTGVIAYAQGRLEDAIAAFDQALALSPDQPEWLGHLAQAQRQAGRAEVAIGTIDRALMLTPLDGNLMAIKAQVLRATGAKDEALLWYRKALAVNPGEASILWNMANLMVDMGRAHEGRGIFERLADAMPNDTEVWNNLAFAAYEDADPDASLAACARCLALAPDHAEAHLNRATALLALGRYAEGWPEFEWRKKRAGLNRQFDIPSWGGEDIKGKTILLHAEQGIGDTLQYLRFVPTVKARGATVVLECPKRLIPLLHNARGVDVLRTEGEALTVTPDVQCALTSLPLALGANDPRDFDTGVYIEAEAERTDLWADRLRQAGGLRSGRLTVGLSWQGNPGYARDHLRSIPTTMLDLLGGAQNADFVSLQGPGTVKETSTLPLIDFGDDLDRDAPFVDTVALIRSLDLVIAVDSAVNHLAGAVGAETWALLSRAPDWRWGMTGTRSPWYPKARLFRQIAERDWSGVLAEVVTALNERS